MVERSYLMNQFLEQRRRWYLYYAHGGKDILPELLRIIVKDSLGPNPVMPESLCDDEIASRYGLSYEITRKARLYGYRIMDRYARSKGVKITPPR